MRKKENSNIMIKILSKILIIIIALFVLLIISVGLNIYFAYELSNYETVVTVTYKNEWELEENSNDKVEVVNGNQYYDKSIHNQNGDVSYGERLNNNYWNYWKEEKEKGKGLIQ